MPNNSILPELRNIDREALDFIISTWLRTGFTPSSGELSERFNIGRGGSTNKIFTALEAHGFITFFEGRNRYIPTDWKGLIASDFARQKGYDSPLFVPTYEEWNRSKPTVSDDMERVRELQRKRAKAWRDRKKSIKGKQ